MLLQVLTQGLLAGQIHGDDLHIGILQLRYPADGGAECVAWSQARPLRREAPAHPGLLNKARARSRRKSGSVHDLLSGLHVLRRDARAH